MCVGVSDTKADSHFVTVRPEVDVIGILLRENAGGHPPFFNFHAASVGDPAAAALYHDWWSSPTYLKVRKKNHLSIRSLLFSYFIKILHCIAFPPQIIKIKFSGIPWTIRMIISGYPIRLTVIECMYTFRICNIQHIHTYLFYWCIYKHR